jgi:hypothetical protein
VTDYLVIESKIGDDEKRNLSEMHGYPKACSPSVCHERKPLQLKQAQFSADGYPANLLLLSLPLQRFRSGKPNPSLGGKD